MRNFRRMAPIFAFGTLIILSAALANILSETDQIPLFLLFMLVSIFLFLIISGAGIQPVERETSVFRGDLFTYKDFDQFDQGHYLYIPGIHRVFVLPEYILYQEQTVDNIETRTLNHEHIDQIQIYISCKIEDPQMCFKRATKGLPLSSLLDYSRSTAKLWEELINQIVHGMVDQTIRRVIWKWPDYITNNPSLKVDLPEHVSVVARSSSPEIDYNPYGLSLNREKLVDVVVEDIRHQAEEWGVSIIRLSVTRFILLERHPDIFGSNSHSLERAGYMRESLEQITHQLSVLSILRRRLQERELQKALFGINVAPEISIEISELRKEIEQKEREIEQLQQKPHSS